MGGYGSGRRRTKTVDAVENVPALDVRALGCDLAPTDLRAMDLTLPDGTVISALVTWECVIFKYRRAEGGGVPIAYQVMMERKAAGGGGWRLYWRCPAFVDGMPCRNTVTKLYFSHGYLTCRRCARLSYTSQHQTALERLMTRHDRVRAKLGRSRA